MSQNAANQDSDHQDKQTLTLRELLELCDKYDLPDDIFEGMLRALIRSDGN
jgi:hypothetical protein